MKDNGIYSQKVCLNSSLVLCFGNYESSNRFSAELSSSFVLMVSVPRGDQLKSNIAFGTVIHTTVGLDQSRILSFAKELRDTHHQNTMRKYKY